MRAGGVSLGPLPLALTLALGCGGGGEAPDEEAEAVVEAEVTGLTAEEAAQGWRSLLDDSLEAWRGYRMDHVPSGWSVQNGVLTFTPGGEGGDLITVDQFEDFELALEWRVEAGGNSGIFYRVAETGDYAYFTGPEMQVLDNGGHADGGSPLTSAGSNYALHGPPSDVTRPVGEWNEVRIVVRSNDVEHWLNGTRVVTYTLGSEEWRALVAASKFADWPGYGEAARGHIGLQDHGDPVWFRNVRIREL